MNRPAWLLCVLAAAAAHADEVKLGLNGAIGKSRLLPDDNIMNLSVAKLPVDPNSSMYINAIGADKPVHPDFGASYRGGPFGIPYVVVAGTTPRVPVTFEFSDDSDHDYYPIPPDPPMERGTDSHIIMLDRDNWRLYELYAVGLKGQAWHAGSGAIFDLHSNESRPLGWTSADAAGLPILPALVRYDEVAEQKEIRHALRFTVKRTRRAFTFPARHWASKNEEPSLPPMGLRLRLKASFDISSYPPQSQVVLKALKEYGMILADNGGDWFISGVADKRWDDADINTLKRVKGSDFEVVLTGNITTP
jgi:hypothetical protein